jgi:hypothetical protein
MFSKIASAVGMTLLLAVCVVPAALIAYVLITGNGINL